MLHRLWTVHWAWITKAFGKCVFTRDTVYTNLSQMQISSIFIWFFFFLSLQTLNKHWTIGSHRITNHTSSIVVILLYTFLIIVSSLRGITFKTCSQITQHMKYRQQATHFYNNITWGNARRTGHVFFLFGNWQAALPLETCYVDWSIRFCCTFYFVVFYFITEKMKHHWGLVPWFISTRGWNGESHRLFLSGK